MNIGIFGGSFNPVHNEHVNIVKAAVAELKLEKVIIISSNITPLKSGRMTASETDRLEMCRLAFGGIACAEVSSYEIEQGGISYSYLTCRHFRQLYPHDRLYLIIGADMYESFGKWKYPEEILKCVSLAVCGREKELQTNGFNAVKIDYIGAKLSSTKIRTLAALGEDISGYVDKNVANYIRERSLYLIDGLQDVKKYLTQNRWEHTVRVAVAAAQNCARLNIPERTAITAAALHDCAKYLKANSAELKGFSCPENVPPPVVHQYSGAYIAEKIFGITDAEILNSIKYHASGRESMSPLEKLIYLSDLLEDGRDFEGVEALREVFAKDIDKCLYQSMKHQLNYLKSSGERIYPLTEKALKYAEEHLNDK